jgi:uncharacterized protein YkwD
MPHLAPRRRVAAMLVAVVALVTITTACFPDVSGGEPADQWDARMFRALNAHRSAAGLPPLANSPKLGNVAGSWAWQMAHDNWLRHQDLTAILYRPEFENFFTLGENIFVAPWSASPESLVDAWIRPGPHRMNILNPGFNVVGVGHVFMFDGRVWVVADFGGL